MNEATRRLLAAVQELSLARSLDGVMEIVRHAARDIGGADGATFVLREGDCCFYAQEDAISPLWKGRRFPMSACISGWVMLNKQTAVIEDIYADPRIPADAYRPTFVKSLAMVPIRARDPIGAIGNYWAKRFAPSRETVRLLEALANFTAIAIENARLYSDLERRVAERTRQLEAANRELEAFSCSVSHDLRAPLRTIQGFSQLLLEGAAGLDAEGKDRLERIIEGCRAMGLLIEDLLRLSRAAQEPLSRRSVDLSALARETAARLARGEPGRKVTFRAADGLRADGDPGLLGVLLENLLGNAWKFTRDKDEAQVEFGTAERDGRAAFFVRDNGAGFDMGEVGKLFEAFERLSSARGFPGSGIGLATARRIVSRHGGRIWAEAAPGEGATFFFTMEEAPSGVSLDNPSVFRTIAA